MAIQSSKDLMDFGARVQDNGAKKYKGLRKLVSKAGQIEIIEYKEVKLAFSDRKVEEIDLVRRYRESRRRRRH